MSDAKPMNPLVPKLIAEFVGTFALIFVGVLVLQHPGVGLTGVALAHGLVIAVMASALMLVSGAHFNPAVTLALLVGRKIGAMEAVQYIVVQLVAGVAAALTASLVLPGLDLAAGTPSLAAAVTPGQGILIEAILTFFLAFVVYGTGVDPRFNGRIGGLAIGLTVTLDIYAGGPLTGAAMNPARWFGPAAAAMDWSNALVYILGPAAGGILAGWVYSTFILPKSNA